MPVSSTMMLLTATLAVPLASPTPNNTTHTLTKRFDLPWIGSMNPWDFECRDKPVGDRPKLDVVKGSHGCVGFSRPANNPGYNVKIFWGTGSYSIGEVTVYHGPGCKKGDEAHKFKRKGKEESQCRDYRKATHAWGSAKISG